MTTVFIAGSMNITRLDRKVKERIDRIIGSGMSVVVGDADGADAAIQRYLLERGARNAVVYCSGSKPRNNVGDWPVHSVDTEIAPGTRAFFTVKDVKMANEADYGLMIWDTKSIGTLSNVLELLNRNKKSVVFVNKEKEFMTVGDLPHLENLVTRMSEHARKKAEEKIRLTDKIEAMKNKQQQMF